jgi:uncharacterized membrane protein
MNRTKTLSLTIIGASLYLALGFSFQTVAFGNIQVRIADALYPLIAVLGFPWLLATFLGHLIFNLYGFGMGVALGVGDLLSPFVFLIPKWLIYKYGNPTWKRLTLTIFTHVLFVAFWVAWLLYTMFGIPFWLSVSTVGIGEFIAEVLLGVPLTLAIKRRVSHG